LALGSTMDEVRYNDPVLHAYERFEAEGYTYGSVIPRQWFDECFGIATPTTITEAETARMLYTRYMGGLRSKLLYSRKMALRTKDGFGQEVVMPNEQAAWAQHEAMTVIIKEVERAKDRLVNVNTAMLTAEEERERTDALAKLGRLGRQSLKQIG
jgi:hypothetical protein